MRMATQFKDLIKKAYATFNEREIDKALSTMHQLCNDQRPGEVAI